MAEALVLDASALLAVLRGEPQAPDLEAILHDAIEQGTEVHAPDLLWLETANVLVRRYGWTLEAVLEALQTADELGVISAEVDRPLLLLALDAMDRHGLTSYDTIYLSLADVLGAKLVTLDDRLAAAAGDRALPARRGPRIAEEMPAYAASPTSPVARWADIGSYLAELRARHASRSGKGRAIS